jgi:hypothetical protein
MKTALWKVCGDDSRAADLVFSFQLPASSFQLPATSYELPATSYQLPASSSQLPAPSLTGAALSAFF